MSLSLLLGDQNKSWLNANVNEIDINNAIIQSMDIVDINAAVSGGTIYINDQVQLKNNVTTIADNSTLSVYSVGNFNVTMTGTVITASQIVNVKYMRIGNLCILQFPATTYPKNNGAASGLVSSAAIAADLIPSQAAQVALAINDVPTINDTIGNIKINTDGKIYMYKGYATAFSQNATGRIEMNAATLVYNLA